MEQKLDSLTNAFAERPVADLRGARGTRDPLGVQILSVPCSFFFWKIWQNRMLAPPPQGNPGSATEDIWFKINWVKSGGCISIFQ